MKKVKRKNDYDVEAIIAFHGRWSWNFLKMEKNKERF
jgi:hypothetical protein